jgi:hypothetical protein
VNFVKVLRRLFRCDRCAETDMQHESLMQAVQWQTRRAQKQEAAFRRAQRQDRMPTYEELYGRQDEATA